MWNNVKHNDIIEKQNDIIEKWAERVGLRHKHAQFLLVDHMQ